MKTRSNTTAVRVMALVVVTLSLALSTFTSMAQPLDSVKSPSDITIQYAGMINGQPVFQVQINNEGQVYSGIMLTDEYGAPLYSEKLKDTQYSKKFQLDITEGENVKVVLLPSNPKTKENQTFSINSRFQMIKGYEITKL
jgi:hypothetical protein